MTIDEKEVTLEEMAGRILVAAQKAKSNMLEIVDEDMIKVLDPNLLLLVAGAIRVVSPSRTVQWGDVRNLIYLAEISAVGLVYAFQHGHNLPEITAEFMIELMGSA